MKGQLKDILNIENIKKSGFKLDEDQVFRHESVSDQSSILSFQAGVLRLFLYNEKSIYSIGLDENNEFITRKFDKKSKSEVKIEQNDQRQILNLLKNSDNLKNIGLDISTENESERGFFTRIVDWASEKITNNQVATEILIGLAVSVAAAPFAGPASVAAGVASAVASKGFVSAAQKTHEENTNRKNGALSSSFKREQEQGGADFSKSQEADQEEVMTNAAKLDPTPEAQIPQALSKVKEDNQANKSPNNDQKAVDITGHFERQAIAQGHGPRDGNATFVQKQLEARKLAAQKNAARS